MRPKAQQVFTVPNPGQFGLNTQDSPLTLPLGFATTAENCVIDKKGRIASRKGNEYVTTTGGTGASIEQIFEAEWADGTTLVFSVGNSKVYTGTTTLTDVTGAATITDDDWQIAQLQDVVYFFQDGHAPLQYDKAVGSLDEVTAHNNYTATVQQGTCVLSAFGRLWTAKGDTIYWSDLLNGVSWGSGTSGSIDLATIFPDDVDTVVALAAHNDFLVIFLKRGILIYSGADQPASMRLHDSVINIGCMSRDTVVNIGSDILFLDDSGFRSLGRTIQEKSSPIGDVARNVNDDLLTAANAETGLIKAVYSRENRFVLLSFPTSSQTYCFSTDCPMEEEGALCATLWVSTEILCQYELNDGTLYFGGTDGIRVYSGDYTEDGAAYTQRLYLPHNSLGVNHVIKIAKELDIVTEGGDGNTVALKWAYDWSTDYNTSSVTLEGSGAAEFGPTGGEFGTSEFGGTGGIGINHTQITGSGNNISIGIETDVSGAEVAIQELNLHTIMGRVY